MTSSIENLPIEVLQQIFILSGSHHFALVSRTFHQVATSQTSVKTQWLTHKFNDHQMALYRGLKWKFFNLEILNQLDALYYCWQINKNIENPLKEIPYKKSSIPLRFFGMIDGGQAYEIVKILLERGASPNEPEGYPLLKSVKIRNLPMVKLLLSKGAKGDVKDNMAMVLCAKNNDIDMAKLLIEYGGVQPDAKSLKESVERQYWEMSKFLLEHNAPFDSDVLAAYNDRGPRNN